MEVFFKTILIWIFRRAPAVLVRWYWTEDRLQKHVIIDVRPRGDALVFNGGEPSEITVYLRIWNMAPFTVEIDRLTVRVWCNGEVCQPLTYTERNAIPSASFKDVYVRGGLGINLEKKFAHLDRISEATLTIHAEVNSSVRNFKIDNPDQGSVRPRMVNVSSELQKKLI